MSLIRFLVSSLSLSIAVTIRMLPIFLVAVGLCGVVAYALLYHPYYLAFVAVIACFPLMAFLTLCAVRAGLVQRRQSHGPDLNKLVRKSLIFGGIFAGIGIFYLVLQAGAVALAVGPNSWTEWVEFFVFYQAANLEPGPLVLTLFKYNALLGLGLSGALAVYMLINAAFAVPIAAHGAMIGVGGPGHEFLYGIGRMMVPMLVVTGISAVLAFYVPQTLRAAFLDDVVAGIGVAGRSPLEIIRDPATVWFALSALFWIWLFCWYAASMAVAYITIRDKIEEEFQDAMGAIRASAVPPTDLAALMRERMERQRGVNTAPAATGLFEDDADPSADDAVADSELFGDMDDAPVQPEAGPLADPSPQSLSSDEIEERFQQRFGDTGNALRGDITSALREAAELEKPAAAPGLPDPDNIEEGLLDAPLEPERMPPVEPDKHDSVPESDEEPDWLSKYLAPEGGKKASHPRKK